MPPTSYDPTTHLLLTPEDTEAPARVVRLRELGLGDAPVPEFDAFARKLADVTRAPYAMVNLIDEHRQYFAGLYTPAVDRAVELGPAPPSARVGRTMARDHGYCPHVIVRRKALVLEDVCDYPRFAGNPVVDEIGVRSYLGAPLIDRTGMALGTVCVVDQEPRPWGRPGLETIKGMAAELVEQIERRESGG
ncbi:MULTISPECIES: GAF domain-containing protein [unclassified Streptomyces]|uniref:GAF domain-containing protein n=1 Tax=unclassified Streptomyces TaxID=2593676 RepID=UPI0022B612DC|nr:MULTISPECIES: GAF domain-containing protein [unclassified Streptomyces]MCZ7415761.1 GAF domain-containing protein [Streptomyces sp. WMMC897]MCZ7434428.1 GAF domain-containing protein [Streptomyces sp. WMMC1477]